MLNRRESREAVFCMVYELDFNKECDIDTLFENAIEERSIENNGYIKETFYGVAGKLGEIDEMIKNKSDILNSRYHSQFETWTSPEFSL